MSEQAMTRAREWLGECAIGGGWCDVHDRRPEYCAPLVEDLAALLDAYAAPLIEERVREAYQEGVRHGRDELSPEEFSSE